jgi:prepilin-type processing-associated H-X9-DG protein
MSATDQMLGSPATTYPTGQSSRGYENSAEITEISQDMLTYIVHRFHSTFPGEQTRLLVVPVEEGGRASYGMNNRSGVMDEVDGSKILMVEYVKAVADLVGPAAGDSWASMVAERHATNMVHVLYADGSVQFVTTSSVDPQVKSIHDEFWLPGYDR